MLCRRYDKRGVLSESSGCHNYHAASHGNGSLCRCIRVPWAQATQTLSYLGHWKTMLSIFTVNFWFLRTKCGIRLTQNNGKHVLVHLECPKHSNVNERERGLNLRYAITRFHWRLLEKKTDCLDKHVPPVNRILYSSFPRPAESKACALCNTSSPICQLHSTPGWWKER